MISLAASFAAFSARFASRSALRAAFSREVRLLLKPAGYPAFASPTAKAMGHPAEGYQVVEVTTPAGVVERRSDTERAGLYLLQGTQAGRTGRMRRS